MKHILYLKYVVKFADALGNSFIMHEFNFLTSSYGINRQKSKIIARKQKTLLNGLHHLFPSWREHQHVC